ncbi:MAG: hypothetical protein JJT78_06260 [Leptospira sp.]|nr:hypothetical protein [Leptospira sp.]
MKKITLLLLIGITVLVSTCSPRNNESTEEKEAQRNETSSNVDKKEKSLPTQVQKEETKKGTKLGKCQGILNWNDAMAKCKDQGKRLPTKEELMDMALTMEVFSGCVEDEDDHTTILYNWSSIETGESKAFMIGVGYTGDGPYSSQVSKSEKFFVNCME